MNLIKCPNCGSKDFVDLGDHRECSFCDSRFASGVSKATSPASSIELNSDVDALLAKCEAEPGRMVFYANLILDIDPSNQQAKKYLK